ncbi:MAG: sugar transferase [Coriobacteriia bacterium]|nr:sugar transferase [Coriobacteriia bacterium]
MSRSRFVAISIVLDALVVNASIVGAFFVRFGGELPAFNFEAYAGLWPLITALYLGAGYVFGLYEPERTESAWEVSRAALQAVTLGTILTAAVAFFAGPRFFSFSRLAIVIAWFAQFALLVSWRLAAMRITPIHWPEQRILIVGTNQLACELADEFERRASWGYRVIGQLRVDDTTDAQSCKLPVLGNASDAAAIVAREQIDRLIVASPVAIRELIEQMAVGNDTDVRVEVIPELYEIFIGTVDSTVSDIPLMELTRPATPGWFVGAKRLFDVLASLVLLVITSPVLLVAAVGILVSMGWPVIFTQERVGRDLASFRLVKFRTMVRDAEAGSGPVLAQAGDSRITPLGRVLRRYRIDELPQLVNILLGHMSFVGPRPERPFFVEQHLATIPGYRERFRVKPGATGLAQVSGHYATTPGRKLKFDLIYMYHQTLLMDLQILVETVRVVLTGRGAR